MPGPHIRTRWRSPDLPHICVPDLTAVVRICAQSADVDPVSPQRITTSKDLQHFPFSCRMTGIYGPDGSECNAGGLSYSSCQATMPEKRSHDDTAKGSAIDAIDDARQQYPRKRVAVAVSLDL